MEHIWSPWRFKYIADAGREPGCVFCRARDGNDRDYLIVHRGKLNFVILNLFPYTTGHLMVVPNDHLPSLTDLSDAVLSEMMQLTRRAQAALEIEYKPDGFNIGMNLGRAAGAGVADHLHLHAVPRWSGDANFVSIIGETRVMPEDLLTTYQKLKPHFSQ
jgi:ATP adenylyltransferase